MENYYAKFSGITATSKYDENTSASLAIACQLAYDKVNIIRQIPKQWGFPRIDCGFIRKGKDIDTQFYLMSNDSHIVIVFRGSDSLPDWFANFQAVRDPGPMQKTLAHEGFQDALFPATMMLTNTLDAHYTHQQKIWVTGHSLGGALCSLYAGMLIENGYPIYGIYTFASPRPGDDNFATQLNAAMKKNKGPHYRVVNTGDVVPHVPPEPFFSHPGSRIILKATRKETTVKSWFQQRVSALKEFIRQTGQVFDVADNHTLAGDGESYIPRLLRHAQRKPAKA